MIDRKVLKMRRQWCQASMDIYSRVGNIGHDTTTRFENDTNFFGLWLRKKKVRVSEIG